VDFDASEVDGLRLAEAIDRQLGREWDNEIPHFLDFLTLRGVANKPSADDIKSDVSRLLWVSFRRSKDGKWESEEKLSGNYTDEVAWYVSAFREEARAQLLINAFRPILKALNQGALVATGILEPETANGWERKDIPSDFIEAGRWDIFRSGSRIVGFDRRGQPDVAYNVVKLVAVAAKVAGFVQVTTDDARSPIAEAVSEPCPPSPSDIGKDQAIKLASNSQPWSEIEDEYERRVAEWPGAPAEWPSFDEDWGKPGAKPGSWGPSKSLQKKEIEALRAKFLTPTSVFR
jgi:hypothetical protein